MSGAMVVLLNQKVKHSWLAEVAVHQLLEVAQRPEGAFIIEGQLLHHLHGADVFHRINPELGIENARPTQAAGAAEFCVLRIV